MDEKRKMQEILNHSLSGLKENPFLSQRVIAQAKGEVPVKKKISLTIILIIAVLLIGTMTALAAGVEDINAILYRLWPEAARALRPLNLSVEKAGIRLDVISAALNDDRLLITYSLTDLEGNRINENTECSVDASFPAMIAESGTNEKLSFNATEHQAVYAAYFELSQGEYPEGLDNMVGFTVNGLESPMDTVLDLWPLMEGQEYKAVPVPGPEKNILGKEQIVRDDAAADAAEKDNLIPIILNPANNLHISVAENVELSGIGWINGAMHVQIHVTDYIAQIEAERRSSHGARYAIYINLRDQQGEDVMWAPGFFEELLKNTPYFTWGISWLDGDDLWIEKIFPIKPEEMEQYVIHAEITAFNFVEDLQQYEWWVTFPGNMIQMEENE